MVGSPLVPSDVRLASLVVLLRIAPPFFLLKRFHFVSLLLPLMSPTLLSRCVLSRVGASAARSGRLALRARGMASSADAPVRAALISRIA